MSEPTLSAKEIYRLLEKSPGMANHVASLGVHAKRYERLIAQVGALVSKLQRSTALPTLLDVGPWWQTELFRGLANVHVNTLGLLDRPPPIDKPRSGERYFRQDLNRAVYEEYSSEIPQHDIVVMAEVLEHLPVAPTHVLRKIKKFLRPGSYLVLSTPNAVAIGKRMKMLRGKCPYTMISEDPNYPSHFREYTMSELLDIATQCGYSCVRCAITNDWNWRDNPAIGEGRGLGNLRRQSGLHASTLVDLLTPATWKESILMVLTS